MTKSYQVSAERLNEIFQQLEEQYVIYAPKRIKNGGRYALTDTVEYKQVHSYDEIEYQTRSNYPMKEVLTPITQTIFYFTEDEFKEVSEKETRDILIFGRACDINAVRIQDQIYIENGPEADYFYQRVRKRLHFVLMECTEQFNGCFCCSVGANKTDMYDLAFRFGEEEAMVEVKEEHFLPYFTEEKEVDDHVHFPEENDLKVEMPEIDSVELMNKLKDHPMWDEYNERCIGCGTCTVTCPTCTCFTTTDVLYNENHNVGERRRTEASCMVDGFDRVQGHDFRKNIGERYRYKIMHKVYAHNKRFGTGPMCVGCGRCDIDCPMLISYPTTLNKLSQAIAEIKAEEREAGSDE